jgi:hypothetical protein
MNTRTGLLRAWILLSALWILICVSAWDLATYDTKRHLETITQCEDYPHPNRRKTHLFCNRRHSQFRQADRQTHIQDLKDDIEQVTAYAISAALVIPLLSLSAGYVTAWLIKGFRIGPGMALEARR